jgi:hypothetical protein
MMYSLQEAELNCIPMQMLFMPRLHLFLGCSIPGKIAFNILSTAIGLVMLDCVLCMKLV